MTKRVLDVGNCRFDHAAVCRIIEGNFDAKVVQAHTEEDMLATLRQDACDLVLVNRVLDRDRSDGIGLIRKIKADDRLAPIPVMLITNYDEYQRAAVEAGAERGFGKQSLSDPATLANLAAILGSGRADSPAAGSVS
jgi:CheY-like chemotaxis protein